MKYTLETLRTIRKNTLNAMEGLSVEELCKVPTGFKNSVLWNAAHNMVSLQLLVYARSSVASKVSQELIDKYRKGTEGPTSVSEEEISQIKSLMLSTVDDLEKDLANGVFNSYDEYLTSFGVNLTSAEEAIKFDCVHEGLHLGYIMAMKKSI